MYFLLNIIKKIVMAGFILYGFNKIAVIFNLVIPINIYTLSFVGIFNIIGLVVLIGLKLVI